MRRWIFVLLGLLVSAIFLYLGFQGLDLGQIWAVLREIDLGWPLLAVGIFFVAVYLKTWRWYFLLRPVREVPPRRLFPVVVFGYMGNNIYPFRIGEVLRAYVLNRREGAPIPATLTTILVERVFDGLTMLAFIFVAALFVEFDEPAIRSGVVVMAILFAAAILVFFALALRPALARRLYSAAITLLAPAAARARLIALADNLMDGLGALRSPRDLALTVGASGLGWVVEASTYWIVLRAFPFEASFFVVLLMVGLANLVTILPTTPGYVGTFHGVVALVLRAFAVPQADAAAFAVLMHAVIWAPVTLAGAFVLVRMGFGWRDFARAEQVVSAAARDHET